MIKMKEETTMKIKIERCYFHSIGRLRHDDIRKDDITERVDRLNFMLDYGYLVPSNELMKIIPDGYKKLNAPLCGDDCIYLAEHPRSPLKSYGNSFHGGEFSAYLEHIIGRPSLVFNEHVVENRKIKDKIHFLSEEVCVQERIPLQEAIAIALPYDTSIRRISHIITDCEENDFLFEFYKEELEQSMKKAMPEREKIKEMYDKIEKFRDIIRKHQLEIPCIDYSGIPYDNIESEFELIQKNNERVAKLVKRK